MARLARWSVDDGQLVLDDEGGSELIRLQQTTIAKEKTMEFIHTCFVP